MFAASLITLRETLEASLVVGVMLAFLTFTQNMRHKKFVWLGVAAGVVFSLIVAWGLHALSMEFEGAGEEIYEGVMMLVAAGLLTWMIFWMINQGRHMKKQIESEVAVHIENNHWLGIFILSFVSTAREGIETAIFLQAAIFNAQAGATLVGALLGIVVAVTLAFVMFKGFAAVPLRTFFSITSILLLLFGAGLVAHGIHEFEEAGLLPPLIEHVWDMNGVLHEDGAIGGLMKGLFGYNGNPSLLEVLGYLGYVGGVSFGWKKMNRKKIEN